jgi:serine/threonine protein kinase
MATFVRKASDIVESMRLRTQNVTPGYVEHTITRYDPSKSRHEQDVTEKWHVQRIIGSGGFGTVRLEQSKNDGKLRAVKVIQKKVLAELPKHWDSARELEAMGILTVVGGPNLLYSYILSNAGQDLIHFVRFDGWFEDEHAIPSCVAVLGRYRPIIQSHFKTQSGSI